MANPFKLLREQIAAARMIYLVRKSGETGKLALVLEEELVDNRVWLAKRDQENQLMQQCIFGMMEGKSPCEWCEDFKECGKLPNDEKLSGFFAGCGCKDWFLRFLTEEEEKTCEQRATAQSAEEREAVGGSQPGAEAGAAL